MLKQVLYQATEAAAAVMKEYADKTFTISNKEGINNLVTEVDHASEKAIIDVISKNFPDHSAVRPASRSEIPWPRSAPSVAWSQKNECQRRPAPGSYGRMTSPWWTPADRHQ